MRRIPVIALVIACLAAACSSPPAAVEVGGGDPPAEPPASDPDGESGDRQPDVEPPAPDPADELPLDRAAALLTEDDVRGPWEKPSTSDSPGWDIGPNQTDCGVYWELEAAASHPFAHRLWFQPGANLNHEVYDTGPAAAIQVMEAASRLAEECPRLSWGEGGINSISSLPVDVDGVVAFEIYDQSGEIIWQAYASRHNLVSRLWRVHFEPGTQPSGEAFDEFEQLAAVMVRRLDGAATQTATTSTIPGTAPSTTSTAAPSSTSLSPPTSTTMSTLPTPTTSARDNLDDHPLAGLLLAEPQLPGGLAVDETLVSTPTTPEDQRIDGCDASEAAVTIDQWFALQRSFVGDAGLEVLQIVGLASSAQEAADAVEQFGLIGDCVPPDDGGFGGFTFAGGPLDGVEGATAVWLEMASDFLSVRFVAYHRDDVVGVVILSETESDQLSSLDLHRRLVQAAIDLAG